MFVRPLLVQSCRLADERIHDAKHRIYRRPANIEFGFRPVFLSAQFVENKSEPNFSKNG
jgi:hypothetical protein